MARSLRWRLQVWHAAILGLAILGFGIALMLQFRWNVLREVDARLLGNARALEGTLRLVPRQILMAGFPEPPAERGEGRPPGPDLGPGDRPPPGDWPSPENRPPFGGRGREGRIGDDRPVEGFPQEGDGRMGDPAPPPNNGNEFLRQPGRDRPDRAGPRPRMMSPDQIEQMLQLPNDAGDLQRADNQPVYFAVYTQNGKSLKAVPREAPVAFSNPHRAVEYRINQSNRELYLRGPENSVIVVGQDIRPQFNQLNWLMTQLIVTGFAVMTVGLLGGWWLAGKAIRPIQQIHQTAARINASNLSERINVDSTDQELRELASILNSMLNRLEESFEQQVRFTADASHELRTPLSVLLSHAELALSRQRSIGEYQDALGTVMRAGQRMKTLVDDLLVLARANAGKLELRRDEIDLKKLADEAVKMFEPLASKRSVQLISQGSEVNCHGDASRLSQVLANLLVNAIQYNEPGGQVEIRAERENGQAVLRIRDTGAGIPENDLPHLFDPFYRVDAARTRETGGSGLGLAICKRIIEAHGGEIRVQSQPHVGSTFEVRLPV